MPIPTCQRRTFPWLKNNQKQSPIGTVGKNQQQWLNSPYNIPKRSHEKTCDHGKKINVGGKPS